MFLLNSVAITLPAEEMLAIEGQVSGVSLDTPYHDLCEYDEEEEEEEEDEEDDWDWNETGDLTKRYMANRTGMNHQVSSEPRHRSPHLRPILGHVPGWCGVESQAAQN